MTQWPTHFWPVYWDFNIVLSARVNLIYSSELHNSDTWKCKPIITAWESFFPLHNSIFSFNQLQAGQCGPDLHLNLSSGETSQTICQMGSSQTLAQKSIDRIRPYGDLYADQMLRIAAEIWFMGECLRDVTVLSDVRLGNESGLRSALGTSFKYFLVVWTVDEYSDLQRILQAKITF